MNWNSTDPLSEKWTNAAYDLFVTDKIVAKIVAKNSVLTAHLEGPCPSCMHSLSQRNLLSLVGSAVKVLDYNIESVSNPTTPARPANSVKFG